MRIRRLIADNAWLVTAVLVIALAAAAHRTLTRTDDIAVVALLCAGAFLAQWLWPTLDRRLADAAMAPLIAFVGCDGSGKSTLTHDLGEDANRVRPTAICYLGLGTGTLGERIKRLPVIGRYAERRLVGKATQTRSSGQKIPGLATAIVVYAFSLGRLRRFNRMLRLRRAGTTVLTDRYPQIECAGFYDGPGLSAAAPRSRLVAAIARHERRLYDYMTAFHPDVVIRLNVDAATALARKPDHKPDLVARKAAMTPLLRFSGAPIVDLDASQPYSVVRGAAAGIVRGIITGAAAGKRPSVAGAVAAEHRP